jgi:hypothetical protein
MVSPAPVARMQDSDQGPAARAIVVGLRRSGSIARPGPGLMQPPDLQLFLESRTFWRSGHSKVF